MKGVLNCYLHGNYTVYTGSTDAKRLEIVKGYHKNKLVIADESSGALPQKKE